MIGVCLICLYHGKLAATLHGLWAAITSFYNKYIWDKKMPSDLSWSPNISCLLGTSSYRLPIVMFSIENNLGILSCLSNKSQTLWPGVIKWLKPVVLKLEHESGSFGGLLSHRLVGSFPRLSDSISRVYFRVELTLAQDRFELHGSTFI